MATDRVLVDTSIFIEFFRKKKKEEAVLHDLLNKDFALHLSVITYFELLCGAKSQALLDDTRRLMDLFEVLDFREPEAKHAASI